MGGCEEAVENVASLNNRATVPLRQMENPLSTDTTKIWMSSIAHRILSTDSVVNVNFQHVLQRISGSVERTMHLTQRSLMVDWTTTRVQVLQNWVEGQ